MYIFLAVVLGIVALVLLLSPVVSRRGVTALLALIPLTLLVLLTVLCSFTTVGARSVGIETSFGRYAGTLDNGLHWIAPWASVEEFSTQLQTTKLQEKHGDTGAVSIAFKGASSGASDVTLRWSITDKGAEALWKSFRTFDNVRDNLVESEVRYATRDVFSGYTPPDAIDGQNLTAINQAIQARVASDLAGRGIAIDSVKVTNIDLGAQAQASINRIVAANANTQTAEANLNTAKVEAQTAKIQSQSQTADTLLRHCLDVVEGWDASKQGPLPATFNCALGGSAGSPVIVGGK